MGFHDAELSISLVDDARIAALAGRFGLAGRPTDVLAFPLAEGEGAEHRGDLLGDVVVSLETAARQARAAGRTLDAELRTLLVHGILHLAGMDHARAEERSAMRALERHLAWELDRLR